MFDFKKLLCHKWALNKCAGVDSDEVDVHVITCVYFGKECNKQLIISLKTDITNRSSRLALHMGQEGTKCIFSKKR